jgi:hypothetical protein
MQSSWEERLMSSWKALMGLIAVFGLSGLVVGEPPASPLVEGREPNPVAREFHQTEKPIGGYVVPTAVSDEPNTDGEPNFPALVWETLLDQFTFPLGTAAMTDTSRSDEV